MSHQNIDSLCSTSGTNIILQLNSISVEKENIPWLTVWRLIAFSTHVCTSFAIVSNIHLASNSTHGFSYSSGSQRSEISFPGCPSRCEQERVFQKSLGGGSTFLSLLLIVSGGLVDSLTCNPCFESLQPLASTVTSLSSSSAVKSPSASLFLFYDFVCVCLCGPFFKVFIEFVSVMLLFYVFGFFWP